jgi:hypothetical protein
MCPGNFRHFYFLVPLHIPGDYRPLVSLISQREESQRRLACTSRLVWREGPSKLILLCRRLKCHIGARLQYRVFIVSKVVTHVNAVSNSLEQVSACGGVGMHQGRFERAHLNPRSGWISFKVEKNIFIQVRQEGSLFLVDVAGRHQKIKQLDTTTTRDNYLVKRRFFNVLYFVSN